MDNIEAEIRRRIYWLALGFDKASAATRGQHVSITREHCATTRLPTAMYVLSITNTSLHIGELD